LIHFVLHDPHDTVAVVVVEGVKSGAELTGWVMDEDRTVNLVAQQDIPIGHKIALKDMNAGDTVVKYGIDMGRVVEPIRAGQHAHVHNIKTKRW
jgi:(2R)-sulfolactate sulfo-lyase subunit alpha